MPHGPRGIVSVRRLHPAVSRSWHSDVSPVSEGMHCQENSQRNRNGEGCRGGTIIWNEIGGIGDWLLRSKEVKSPGGGVRNCSPALLGLRPSLFCRGHSQGSLNGATPWEPMRSPVSTVLGKLFPGRGLLEALRCQQCPEGCPGDLQCPCSAIWGQSITLEGPDHFHRAGRKAAW